MSQADLPDAHLQQADLRNAVIRRADLRGADLTDALLDGADLTGIKTDDTTVWPKGYPRPLHAGSPDTAGPAPVQEVKRTEPKIPEPERPEPAGQASPLPLHAGRERPWRKILSIAKPRFAPSLAFHMKSARKMRQNGAWAAPC